MKIKGFYFIFCFLLLFACTNKKVDTPLQMQFPQGKWKAFRLQNKDSVILFDLHKNYYVVLQTQNQLTITAEDNTLRGEVIKTSGDSLQIKAITKTDVCCNSKTAEALFDFFTSSFQIKQQNSKLILSSENGVLELTHSLE